MRILIALIAAIAGLVSIPACAQSLTDLIGIGRGASNGLNSLRYSSCTYEQGLFRQICRVQRAADTVDRANQLRRQYDQARRRDATSVEFTDVDPATISRLQTLCADGGEEACAMIRRMRRDGTAQRVAERRAAMDPRMQRAEDAYERARAAQRAGRHVSLDDMHGGETRFRTARDYTVQDGSVRPGQRFRVAPDYTRSER